MVAEGVIGIRVTAETLLTLVIVMIHLAAFPVTVAFDSEMVIAFGCKSAASRIGLQKTLGQGNTGRYPVFLHLFNSHDVVLGYVGRKRVLGLG